MSDERNPDEIYADATPEPDRPAEHEDFIDDVTDLGDPEDYDFAAMVAGVKPNRARVRIRPRSDLYARLQEIAEQWATLEGQEVPASELEEIEAEWAELKAAYDRTFVVVVEGRTSDWSRSFRKELRKRGIDPDRKGLSDGERAKHQERALNAQIAAQIVHPTKGVTEESVAALAVANEVEANKLYMALAQVNTRPSGDVDFLRGRSPRNRAG